MPRLIESIHKAWENLTEVQSQKNGAKRKLAKIEEISNGSTAQPNSSDQL